MNFEFHYNLPCGSWLENTVRLETERHKKIIEHELEEKEVPTMQVTYNGLTGKLLKMEFVCENYYDIIIHDSEREAKVSFSGVKFEDMKFHGGAVTFGG